MCNKSNVLKIFYLFSFSGLLVFGTVRAGAHELHRENQALAGSFAYVQQKTVEEEKQHQPDVKLSPIITAANQFCVECHKNLTPALVMEWERSRHAQEGVGCVDCHNADKGEIDAWQHMGALISTLVTPKDCSSCHVEEYKDFSRSHHAKAGEIFASMDNVLAEQVIGLPWNNADAVNGCWQCHGSIIRFQRNDNGEILREGGKPLFDPDTWPNSGIGRLNPDGSKGSCHACHSRHSFEAKLSRAPENCGKCHMGPDHPQIEIYRESKHGIAYTANIDHMALDKEGGWVLGKDYSAAPTCTTCHISSYMTSEGQHKASNHDVGERISWTLRPVVSTKINMVVYEDGFKEDYPDTRQLPEIGEEVLVTEKNLQEEKLVTKIVSKRVVEIVTWQERREKMKGVCRNCHNQTHVDNFYHQFDNFVNLYNEKFAKPAQAMMNSLIEDEVLNTNAPFEHEVQWVFWELWHHEGRRARHGASMMGPDYAHWHGLYEVAKHYYVKFLPSVIKAAAQKSDKMKIKYEQKIKKLLQQPEHAWVKGLSEDEIEVLKSTYENRYN
ncbi:hydroxylamine oxidoreductase [Candidatus Scalindua japonica]|uniref:Hydroxylamine oxidoreductase n=1 Tax=Candidatus Scalindua japonica TaxID=1284222 RepID=A0A286U080_9BACT|nr:multiheme c-type cytochrome [Candidatus Scalindua japonica]GAX61537.1 hydroxylamine oxidoreductase [Candidatus Scalindua japonica]